MRHRVDEDVTYLVVQMFAERHDDAFKNCSPRLGISHSSVRRKVACECRRSRGTTRPRTAAASTRVCLMQPPHGYASFQIKSSTRLCSAGFLLCSQLSNATGTHVPARSRTAAALIGPAHLLGLEFSRLQCRFLKKSWPRSSAEPVCRRNGGLTRPRRTLDE